MFTVEELAHRWGVNVKTIYNGIAAKQVPVVCLGRRVIRIPVAAIEQLEQKGRVEPHGGTHGR
jgi:excisionase family DNA binding protein